MDLAPNTNCRIFDTELPENLFYSNIYLVSSRRPKLNLNENMYEDQKSSILEAVEDVEDEHEWLQGKTDLPDIGIMPDDIMAQSRFMLTYHASLIESRLSKIITTDNKGFYCNRGNNNGSSCGTVFAENEKALYMDMRFTGKVCKSTLRFSNILTRICRQTIPSIKFKSTFLFNEKPFYLNNFRL